MRVGSDLASMLAALNRQSLPGIDLTLDRMKQLLAALGDPQNKLPPVIHVAGTNGKGSTIAFLRAIYEAAGYKVHCYTSPHLVRFNERIVVAGEEISDAALQPLLAQVTKAAKSIPVTFFEATTAVAYLAFAQTPADMALLETGLGGRLDATNMVDAPIATVITPIDYDHMEFLGETLAKIAQEKAGIIKPGVLCVLGAQRPEVLHVLARVAYQNHAPLVACGHSWNAAVTATAIHVLMDTVQLELPLPSLIGDHQTHNAALAAVVAQSIPSLRVTPEAIAQGIQTAKWPARLQKLTHGPLVDAWGKRGAVMLDGGHNVSAARMLADWISKQAQPVTLLCGMMARKDAVAFFTPLARLVREVITTNITEPGAYTADNLADAARTAGLTNVHTCKTPEQIQASGAACGEGALLVAGSLFLAGEILKNHG